MKILKRTFGKDGGSLKTIRDERGVKDDIWKWALLIRVLTPVIIAVIGLVVSHLLGIDFKEFIDALKQVKEVIILYI